MDSAGTAVRSVDRRGVDGVGRRARLELVFTRRRGRTVLAHGYAEPPLRVGRCFPDENGARMILVCAAPGIFAGDIFEQHVRVESGARVHLTSQSALQIHPGTGVARLSSRYDVDAGGVLSCEWHPAIPFAGARLDQRISIALAADATLVWSDGFTVGRAGYGERWAFDTLAHELKISRGASIEYLERYRLHGDAAALARPWVGGRACYFGSVVRSGPATDAVQTEQLHADLTALPGLRAAADVLQSRLLLVRLMAENGVPFHAGRALAARALGNDARIIGCPKGEAV